MKLRLLIAISFLISLSLLSACRSEQPLTPTLPPTQKPTPTLTQIPTLQPTATSTSAIPMDCDDWALVNRGNFQAQNNTWGKGSISDWSQCIGIEINPDGTLDGRWTWDWHFSGSGVMAYPEIIFGQKPGSSTTSPELPIKLADLGEVTVSYDVTSTHTGSGNLAFDIWLTDIDNPSTWGVPPITHEIMIWLENYGGMMPGGSFKERVSIDGSDYNVFVGEHWGDGWRYMAFARVKPQLGMGSLNISGFVSYLLEKELVTGEEYMASLEFGNELVSGLGETILTQYNVTFSARNR
jgi:hypothetical protein